MSSAPSLSSKDFTAAYLALQRIADDVRKSPDLADERLIRSLEGLLEDKTHAGQTRASFLYRLAAEVLGELVVASPQAALRQRAALALHHFATHTLGDPCLAASKALGSLPVRLEDPGFTPPSDSPLPEMSLEEAVKRSRISPGRPYRAGRCLVLPDRGSEEILVLKCAARENEIPSLRKEGIWIATLSRSEGLDAHCRFEVPRLLRPEEKALFRVTGHDPLCLPSTESLPGGRPAAILAFTVHRDYFVYAQGPHPGNGVLPSEQFCEIMARNSYLFGRLAAKGILHTAPIPLFHNRVQQERRDDHGLYLWERRGRLDRWLDSTLYPNFGLSGLRDFEHLEPAPRAGSSLYRWMGNEILGLLLVCGSYFRLREPDRIGREASNAPVDVRHLFDTDLLARLIGTVFSSYYEGFTQCTFGRPLPPTVGRLAERMREEMGVDRYMVELWRASNQSVLAKSEFFSYLRQQGFSEERLAGIQPGREDLPLCTGPHLGEFNRSISLPELIDFTAGATAACISAKYLQDKGSLARCYPEAPQPG